MGMPNFTCVAGLMASCLVTVWEVFASLAGVESSAGQSPVLVESFVFPQRILQVPLSPPPSPPSLGQSTGGLDAQDNQLVVAGNLFLM